MTDILNSALLILFVIFAIINMIIYHKIFKVYYFGNPFKGLAREFAGSFIVAILEVGIIAFVGKWLLKVMAGVGKWLLKIFAVIAIVVCIIIIISAIIKLFKIVKEKKTINVEPEKESEKLLTAQSLEPSFVEANKIETSVVSESVITENKKCADLGQADTRNDLDKYILQNYSSDTKLDAIKYYRSQTGLGLKEAKENVESLFSGGVVKPITETGIACTFIFCTSCGEKIARTAKFCNFCGARNTYKG